MPHPHWVPAWTPAWEARNCPVQRGLSWCALRWRDVGAHFLAPHPDQEHPHQQDRDDATHAHGAGSSQHIALGFGVIVKTEQQEFIKSTSQFALASLSECQPQV